MSKDLPDHMVSFRLNQVEVSVSPRLGQRLSEVLREELGAKDVKVGCDAGDCGACTVLIDKKPVCACLVPCHRMQGHEIETLSGLMREDQIAQDLAGRFKQHGAAQCGVCTPGMMVSSVALLKEVASPTEMDVKNALGGVLCRCTGYRKIIDAVMGLPVSDPRESGVVGTSTLHVDADLKLKGQLCFGDDVGPRDCLEIMVIRSPFHRAQFTFGDLEGFASDIGADAVLTAKDVPGENKFGVIPQFVDQPVFAEGETRFRGEAVAAIVAAPEVLAFLAPADFPIEWTELSSVHDIASAQSAEANELHSGRERNVMCGGFVAKGNANDALDRADVVVEGHFRSGFVEHAYIEPEAGFARIVDSRVEVHACTQAPIMDREALGRILGMAASDIRVVPTAVGGGFGSKLDLSVQPFLALAALKTGQPIRMRYSRSESMQSSTKRHPSEIQLRVGATKNGVLSGVEFYGEFDTGAYASWGPTVANRVPVHASGPYSVLDYRAESKGIHTNNPPSGAFRGFGVPQSAIAQESLFDELAERLGIDALEFRILNALENGMPTVCGQVFEQGVGIKQCLVSLRAAWQEERERAASFNKSNPNRKRGVGVAGGWYGCGNTSLPNPSTIKAGISPDGRVILHQGAVDIGQGSNTVISQIFAKALGICVSKIELVGADTDVTPDAGKTSASRQTYVSGNAARLAGETLRSQILARLNVGDDAALEIGPEGIAAVDAGVEHRLSISGLAADADGFVLRAEETYDPPTRPLDENGQGAPYAMYGYAAHLAVVEVDLELGTVKPLKVVAAHDVGQAINPMLVEGQVHGGIAQGLGMALMEEYIPGRTENLHDYLIPTIGDVPPIETIIIEEPDAHGPFGAKGLGEHVLIPTAPAFLNAIKAATGVRMNEVPVTPSRLHAALARAQA